MKVQWVQSMNQTTKCVSIVNSLHDVHLAALSLCQTKCSNLLQTFRFVCVFATNRLSSQWKSKQRHPQRVATRSRQIRQSILQMSGG